MKGEMLQLSYNLKNKVKYLNEQEKTEARQLFFMTTDLSFLTCIKQSQPQAT